jgi:hypothetical protein
VTDTEPSLFDADRYGPAKTKRRKVVRPEVVRLNKPWVLVGRANHQAEAHVLAIKPAVLQDGAVRTRCERYGYVIEVDGHPLAAVCRACFDIMHKDEDER